MKATITDLKQLRAIMLVLKKNRARSSSLDVLTRVLVRATNSHVELVYSTTNHWKIMRVEADVTRPGGGCTVDLLDLDKLVLQLKKRGGQITLTHEPEEALEVEHHTGTFRMLSRRADEYVEVPGIERTTSTSDASRLRRVLESTSIAMSSDTARMNLCGVYFDGENAVSTDGHRLRRMDFSSCWEGIVHEDGVTPLAYALKKLDVETVLLAQNSTHVRADFGEHTMIIRKIEGTFPDFTQVIPREYGVTIKTDASVMEDALDSVSLFTRDKTALVRFSSHPAELYASDPEKGEACAEIGDSVSLGDGKCEVGFNAHYLDAALDDLEGAIEIGMIDVRSPVRFRREDDDSGEWIVMPMRL